MNCDKTRELLVALLDGELRAQEEAACQAHLKGCPACAAEKKLLEASWQALDHLPAVTPSANWRADFWRRAREEEAAAIPWFAWPRLAPVLAGALGVWIVGIGSGMLLFSRSSAVVERQSSFALIAAPERATIDSAYISRMPRTR